MNFLRQSLQKLSYYSPLMRVFIVKRGHFRSRATKMVETLCYRQSLFMAVCFIEPELLPIKILHCGNCRLFWTIVASVTLTLTRWPSYTNLTRTVRTPSRYTGRAKMNFLRQGFRKLSFDRHTDRTEYHAPSWVITNASLKVRTLVISNSISVVCHFRHCSFLVETMRVYRLKLRKIYGHWIKGWSDGAGGGRSFPPCRHWVLLPHKLFLMETTFWCIDAL